ncbi:unnamed protein product [marine sediment metagenome]|uniref:Uncharacterized protein n=1 Tax=marine sediment metagenome TaxID=412755 RepID=X1VRV3_9ZZZZ
MPDGASNWYDCPSCNSENKFYEEWITLSELKALLEPGVKKDGVPDASD